MRVASRLGRDFAIWSASFVCASWLRFGDFQNLGYYSLSIGLGGLTFCILAYVLGLYSRERLADRRFVTALFLVSGAILAGLAVCWVVGSLRFSSRLGRGVTIRAIPMIWTFVCVHHWLLHHRIFQRRDRIGFIVNSEDDVQTFLKIKKSASSLADLVGVITTDSSIAVGSANHLGEIIECVELVARHRLDRVVFGDEELTNPTAWGLLSRLRYSGVACVSLPALCEELFHCVPLELVTPEWLLQASSMPRPIYLTKGKRVFDVIVSGLLLAALSPPLLLGMLLVKLTSKGPIFYRQKRLGRFGRAYFLTKLRTMRVDAEKDGPQWAKGSVDSRLTPVGGMLRKYRIDEIPQLLNILVGNMSFVGPRPERPEFVTVLEKEIPCYRERLLAQPGLSGWAQVNFPYGSSIDDARRKLEFDLYYIKHMGFLLDLLTLFDTVRIVLTGGVGGEGSLAYQCITHTKRNVSPVQEIVSPASVTESVQPG